MSDTMNILFLCTGNSCRSQMAEGWCRSMDRTWLNAHRPGSRRGLNPNAVQVMAEAGVDISRCSAGRRRDRWPLQSRHDRLWTYP